MNTTKRNPSHVPPATFNLGDRDARDARLSRLDRLAEALGVGDRSTLLQKIADGELVVSLAEQAMPPVTPGQVLLDHLDDFDLAPEDLDDLDRVLAQQRQQVE